MAYQQVSDGYRVNYDTGAAQRYLKSAGITGGGQWMDVGIDNSYTPATRNANALAQEQIKALQKQNAMTWHEVKPQLLETEEQKAAKAYLTGQMNTDQMYGGNRFADTSAQNQAMQNQLNQFLAGNAKQNQLMDLAQGNINTLSNSTYGGERFAGNEYTNQLKSQLEAYLKGEQSNPLMQSASQQVQDTLGGTKYDPLTGAYYQGVRQQAELNLNDSLQKYRQNQYLKGNLRSTVTDAGQARMLAENTANLNQMLGSLQNQERQNQLAAVSQAASLANQYDAMNQSRLGTTQSLSSYLTGQQQLQKDLAYQQYQDELARKSSAANQAASLAGQYGSTEAQKLDAVNAYNQYIAAQEQKKNDFAYEQWKANLERKNAIANQLFTTAQTYMYPQYQLR